MHDCVESLGLRVWYFRPILKWHVVSTLENSDYILWVLHIGLCRLYEDVKLLSHSVNCVCIVKHSHATPWPYFCQGFTACDKLGFSIIHLYPYACMACFYLNYIDAWLFQRHTRESHSFRAWFMSFITCSLVHQKLLTNTYRKYIGLKCKFKHITGIVEVLKEQIGFGKEGKTSSWRFRENWHGSHNPLHCI